MKCLSCAPQLKESPTSEQILHKEELWKTEEDQNNLRGSQRTRTQNCSNWNIIHEEENLALSPVFTPEYQIYIIEEKAGGMSAGVSLDPPTAMFDNVSGSLPGTWWSLSSWVVPLLCVKSICVSICIYSEVEYEPIMYAYDWRLSLILFFLQFVLLPASSLEADHIELESFV